MPKKIIVVEDDYQLAQMYEFKLRSSGYDVYTAANGKEGLELIEKHTPDLVLLDLMMPIMMGDEMLKKLRQTHWGASLRVIVLTNISKDEAPQELRLLNVDRYVVKAHYTPTQVVQIVKEVLDKK